MIAHLKAAGRLRPALLQRIDSWDKLREQVTSAQTQQRELEMTLIERRALVAVVDLDWDDVVNRLSGTAFLVSGKQADQDPYAALFGTVKSKDARQMGPAKAATFGKYTVARGEGLAHPELEALLDELKTLSDELIEADTSRDEADIELAMFRQTNKELARAIEQEVAETEIAILTAAKGRR
ncbi:MAG: hypothetical protein HUU55_23960, partial [Myxococcales bacterium]|nr:hypothetical protein [Myxococcales bacterium]